ncbi:hypothetical protein NMY22_g16941 [Coprinellus aureogranulatus]|nr:hypothetical protein NMY22_g16941 [Coprinellus aureogranulatus]
MSTNARAREYFDMTLARATADGANPEVGAPPHPRFVEMATGNTGLVPVAGDIPGIPSRRAVEARLALSAAEHSSSLSGATIDVPSKTAKDWLSTSDPFLARRSFGCKAPSASEAMGARPPSPPLRRINS